MTWDEYCKSPEYEKCFPCPQCFAEFDTAAEKLMHLKEEHQYSQEELERR